MTPAECTRALAANIRAERARADLRQEYVAERMRDLGYSSWLRQTVANIENGKRRIQANEVIALAGIFGTTVPTLMEVP